MRELRRKYPVLVSIALVLLFVLGSALGSLPLLLLGEGFLTAHLYLAQLIAELVALAVLLLATLILGMAFVLRRSGKPLGQKLTPCLPILALYVIAGLEAAILCMEEPVQPPLDILWFVLCMLAVGLTEELLFRGLITRMLYEKYGKSAVGVWLSVLTSSLLFGLVHLTNAAADVPMSGVLVQMAGAAALGVCLAAIYLRTGSFWTVALLHSFMDFCALLSTGVFRADGLEDVIGGYGASNLLGAALYLALGLFLLRPAKMKQLAVPGAPVPANQLVGLMIVTALLSGLLSAVTVLSI